MFIINFKVSYFCHVIFFAVSSKKPFSFLFFKICVPLAYVPADCCLLTLSFSKFYIFILSPIFFWDFLEFLALKIFKDLSEPFAHSVVLSLLGQ